MNNDNTLITLDLDHGLIFSLTLQVMSISASMDDPSIDDEDLSRLEIQSKKLQRTAEDNTPEGIFPYVLYLLSHPPAFPEGYEDSVEIQKKKAEGVFKSLKMVSTAALDGDGHC